MKSGQIGENKSAIFGDNMKLLVKTDNDQITTLTGDEPAQPGRARDRRHQICLISLQVEMIEELQSQQLKCDKTLLATQWW